MSRGLGDVYKRQYLYYALKNARIPNTGYNRHFKWLKEVQIEYPDYRRQENVVKILDKVSDLIETRQHEIKRLDDLIKARFVYFYYTIMIVSFTNLKL